MVKHSHTLSSHVLHLSITLLSSFSFPVCVCPSVAMAMIQQQVMTNQPSVVVTSAFEPGREMWSSGLFSCCDDMGICGYLFLYWLNVPSPVSAVHQWESLLYTSRPIGLLYLWPAAIDLWRISPDSEAPGSVDQMSMGNNMVHLSSPPEFVMNDHSKTQFYFP